MQIRELSIPDTYEITPKQHADDRGLFLEWYRFDKLAEVVGHPLNLAQGNTSVSKKGTVRGIHYAQIPPSQAKYVTALRGAVLDFVIDIRVGSPTFGKWDSVLLDDLDRKAVYISEGIGHCFVALTPNATVSYLVNATFNAEREFGINPLDEEIGLKLEIEPSKLLLAPKDVAAPSLAEAAELGILPTWDEAKKLYASLDGGVN